MRTPDCHPDRKHLARGLCQKCYATSIGKERALIRAEKRLSSGSTPTTKQCPRCELVKPASEYMLVKWNVDGLHTYCRPCRNIRNGQWKKKKWHNEPWRRQIIDGDRARHRALRQEVVAAYGGKCACCGEATFEFLSIDHIDNNGSAHKKSIGGASALCRWLKKSGFPQDGFQLLCHNCNLAKGFYGGCPHQGEPPGKPLRAM